MTAPRPIYCHLGACTATHRVKSAHREAVTCGTHLPRTQKWAGAGAVTERLDGRPVAAVAAEQLDLFTTSAPLEDL